MISTKKQIFCQTKVYNLSKHGFATMSQMKKYFMEQNSG